MHQIRSYTGSFHRDKYCICKKVNKTSLKEGRDAPEPKVSKRVQKMAGTCNLAEGCCLNRRETFVPVLSIFNQQPTKKTTLQLRMTTKTLYKIVRLVHHLLNVTTKVKNIKKMITFKRMTDYLFETVKLVASTKKTQQLLEGYANNWAYSILHSWFWRNTMSH